MNTAIIVAAGSGSRFGSDIPKQFLTIAGKPVLFHTLQQFEGTCQIHEIIAVVPPDWIEIVHKLSLEYLISGLGKVVAGGATRAESVRNGLEVVDPSTQIVVVHDGARPFVTVQEIDDTVAKADETGAACLVAEVTDTIKEVRENVIVGTVDRNKLRRALTPQAFRYDILQRAFANAHLGDNVTDECYLVEKLGVEIAAVEGSSRNIKITRPEDIRLAEIFLSEPPA